MVYSATPWTKLASSPDGERLGAHVPADSPCQILFMVFTSSLFVQHKEIHT